MIRDRKMYVCPTPFALTDGTAAQRTLVLPDNAEPDQRLEPVGTLVRVEAASLVVGYEFDLRVNTLTPRLIANPHAGARHRFVAYRRRGTGGPRVAMKAGEPPLETAE